jgi:hypothetical protein
MLKIEKIYLKTLCYWKYMHVSHVVIFPFICLSIKNYRGPGTVTHIYNPRYSGGRDGRIIVQKQPRPKS